MLPNFSWVIKGKLAGMARPWLDPETVGELRREGVGAIVSLTVAPLEPEFAEAFDYAHFPVRDFAAPTQDQIRRFIDQVDEWLVQGKPVAVHCTAGYGRTGTMLACYLVHTGLSAAKAIAQVVTLRPGSIETEEQRQAIRDYAERVMGK